MEFWEGNCGRTFWGSGTLGPVRTLGWAHCIGWNRIYGRPWGVSGVLGGHVVGPWRWTNVHDVIAPVGGGVVGEAASCLAYSPSPGVARSRALVGRHRHRRALRTVPWPTGFIHLPVIFEDGCHERAHHRWLWCRTRIQLNKSSVFSGRFSTVFCWFLIYPRDRRLACMVSEEPYYDLYGSNDNHNEQVVSDRFYIFCM